VRARPTGLGMVALSVDVAASEEIPPSQVDAARRHVEALGRYTDASVTVRLTLRRGGRRAFVADASTVFDGRVLAAHATGPAADAAADAVAARRNDPVAIARTLEDLEAGRLHRPEARLKPPEQREIVRRRTYSDHPEATLEAISDLLDLDEEFHLFVHVRTGEDVVVHHRDDRRIGLLHPRGSLLGDEEDEVVAPEPSRYSEPLSLATARSEMDMLEHRFVYFLDAGDRRGKVIYLRFDGDYGLVEPR
jgi:hypothetical protein